MSPFNEIKIWLEQEKSLGSENPGCMILATAGKNAIPHSRIVAIREIAENSILFFTQQGTRKDKEIQENPVVSATIWLAMQQRQIMLDGKIESLTEEENAFYWKTLPRSSQLKFFAYAPTSGQPIESEDFLKKQYDQLSTEYPNELPMSSYYCGYRLVPKTIYFYILGMESFSKYVKYELKDNIWHERLLSP